MLSILLAMYLGAEFLDHMVILCLNFEDPLVWFLTAAGWTMLHVYQPCTKVPISPYPHKICSFPFLLIATLMDLKYYCPKLFAQCSSHHNFISIECKLHVSKYFADSLLHPQLGQAHSLCSINMYWQNEWILHAQ